MSGWAESVIHPEMYAGVAGRSADMAAWALAAQLEAAKMGGTQMSAMSIDIMKCFDQISRPLVWTIAVRCGAPRKVLSAWLSLMDATTMRNCLADSIGVEYKRALSIPQ